MNTPNKTDKKKLDTKWLIAAIVVPIFVAVIGYLAATRGNKGDVHIGDKIYGITPEEYEVKIRRERERIRKELQESIRNEEYGKQQKLEIEHKAVGEKLNNLQQGFEEETKRRKEADAALAEFRGELPEAKLEEAKENLQSGDTIKAEELFDTIYDEGSVQVALAAYQSGRLAEGRIDYIKAIQKYREAVAIESNNPDYLLAAGIMARTLGDYKEAQAWLEKLLQLCEQETPETVELAQIQHNLAWLYSDMGKYEEAEPLYKRSLEVRESALGKAHPEVATTLNNLANLYRQQGKYEEAEPFYKRSLEITEKSLGPDHPSIATILNNLADLYSDMGKYKEAEPFYKRSL
ncbi:MAG: tetratricopeptide repeat protein, partial [Deltaproteobacteria bacterium]|nr:tetratricopeptide repeat protein [Deltaproteobacteria bacterium]